jgi:hypothetical protein
MGFTRSREEREEKKLDSRVRGNDGRAANASQLRFGGCDRFACSARFFAVFRHFLRYFRGSGAL